MTNEEIILEYAYEHNEIVVRKDFMHWFKENRPNGSIRSMDSVLQQMVTAGTLVRTKNGVFSLGKVKRCYRPVVTDEMRELFAKMREHYPYTNSCIWQASALGAFMQHVPNLDVLILEVEKQATEAMFEDVRDLGGSWSV